ncbi:Small GTPase [Dillenia turbinata]|uniref:Small GTPase n=1 Tax=Dillenia turbinata TaxID=194707 RepID=A0AAN8UG87_9MAGN
MLLFDSLELGNMAYGLLHYPRFVGLSEMMYVCWFQDSFVRAKKWVQELQKQGNPNLVMALVGNKIDLESKREVTAEEAEQYSQEKGMFFIEASAKTLQNVNDLFYEIDCYRHFSNISLILRVKIVILRWFNSYVLQRRDWQRPALHNPLGLICAMEQKTKQDHSAAGDETKALTQNSWQSISDEILKLCD